MKLIKAIEILAGLSQSREPLIGICDIEALKLGIEALKREGASRTKYDSEDSWLLPGETKE